MKTLIRFFLVFSITLSGLHIHAQKYSPNLDKYTKVTKEFVKNDSLEVYISKDFEKSGFNINSIGKLRLTWVNKS